VSKHAAVAVVNGVRGNIYPAKSMCGLELNGIDDQRSLLARRLREAREHAGMSQEEVALTLAMSRPTVGNMETGVRKVEAVELHLLSTLYGRTVDFLLGREQPSSDTRVASLARATRGLTDQDMSELARFAKFLKSARKSNMRGAHKTA
jgi:transcriptional regulator with XRE-family HTH domain